MPETPPQLRGRCYNTSRVTRCPNYHPCEMCKMCRSFNPHSALCQWCESTASKRQQDGKPVRCNHTLEQEGAFIRITRIFKKPMAHLDNKFAGGEILEQYNDQLALQEAENALDKLGKQAKDY